MRGAELWLFSFRWKCYVLHNNNVALAQIFLRKSILLLTRHETLCCKNENLFSIAQFSIFNFPALDYATMKLPNFRSLTFNLMQFCLVTNSTEWKIHRNVKLELFFLFFSLWVENSQRKYFYQILICLAFYQFFIHFACIAGTFGSLSRQLSDTFDTDFYKFHQFFLIFYSIIRSRLQKFLVLSRGK